MLNRVSIIGNIGDDIKISDVKASSTKKMATFPLAVTNYWFDDKTKEKKSQTSWFRIVVFGEPLVEVIQKIDIGKGSKVLIEGRLASREWVDNTGAKKHITEIMLKNSDSKIIAFSRNNNHIKSTSLDEEDYENIW